MAKSTPVWSTDPPGLSRTFRTLSVKPQISMLQGLSVAQRSRAHHETTDLTPTRTCDPPAVRIQGIKAAAMHSVICMIAL